MVWRTLKYFLFSVVIINWGIIITQAFVSNGSDESSNEVKPSHEEVLHQWRGPIKVSEGIEITHGEDFVLPEDIQETDDTLSNDIPESNEQAVADEQVTEEELNDIPEAQEIVFQHKELSDTLIDKMEEISPLDTEVITYEQLRHVVVTHWGFDGKVHQGNMIVNEKVADEVVEIFEEVFNAKYPIAKMKLTLEYDNSDRDSMSDNNTSGFNYRPATNSDSLSAHAYGLAIDVNPQMNPYVSDSYILPVNSAMYVERNDKKAGMIQEGDALYNAFTSRGWEWGGSWRNTKDYQHFSKVDFE